MLSFIHHQSKKGTYIISRACLNFMPGAFTVQLRTVESLSLVLEGMKGAGGRGEVNKNMREKRNTEYEYGKMFQNNKMKGKVLCLQPSPRN